MATPKDIQDFLPILKDQGITNVVASANRGAGMQFLAAVAMPADGIFNFEDLGLEDMAAVGEYCVFVQNHTDAADEATCLAAARLTSQFTLTGPDTSDVLDILIVGQIKGQLA